MVPNSHMDTYACEWERSYTETVGNGRMDGPSGVRSHACVYTATLYLTKFNLNLVYWLDRYLLGTRAVYVTHV